MTNILDFFFFKTDAAPKIWNISDAVGPFAGPRIWRISAVFGLAIIALQLFIYFYNATDYVGIDSDDSMRLVEVRDFLAGQGWFDLYQYRLGPEGGTLMHWSRLIDAPIAALIALFNRFFEMHAAEAIALAIWPQVLIFPLMASIALAAFRLGGRNAMLIALVIATCMVLELIRFRPGGIDHHNVQMVLVAAIAAFLLDPDRRASNFAAAGLAAALALTIGAETTPVIAAACVIVAIMWAMDGEEYRSAAFAFASGLGLGSAVLFVATTPVTRYMAITCDNFSFGYLAATLTGAALLALCVRLMSGRPRIARFASLTAIGVATGLLAAALIPHCIVNPLGDLDPLLVELWLNKVVEARSVISLLESQPAAAGSFYAIGFMAIATCLIRILHNDRRTAHAILLGLLIISWVVTLIQIRGYMFSNLLGIIVLAALVSDLRELHSSQPKNQGAAMAFLIAALVSIPAFWAIAGGLGTAAARQLGFEMATRMGRSGEDRKECASDAVMNALASLPTGRIMTSSNLGSMLLRKTPHNVLTAAYHRNQTGMLAEIRASIAEPVEAESVMRQAGVSIVYYCKSDSRAAWFAKQYPAGLYANLDAGNVPDYLELQKSISSDNVGIYRLKPPR